jgi:hypothetical protein
MDHLGKANAIDWSRAALDGTSIPAKRGGLETVPNLTDRSKPASKRYVVINANGIPLAVPLSSANRHDSRMLDATLDAVPTIRQFAGRTAAGPPSSMPIRAMTSPGADTLCAAALSSPASRGGASILVASATLGNRHKDGRASHTNTAYRIANCCQRYTIRMPQHAGSRIGCPIAPLFSRLSGGRNGPSHRDIPKEEPSMLKWTIRLRWKGQTIEIEIEIGLSL